MSNQSEIPPTAEALRVSPLKWTEAEAAAFRTFLDRNKSFLPYLAAHVPKIKGDNLESMALTGATHAGYEELFRVLGTMTEQQEAAIRSPYITEDES